MRVTILTVAIMLTVALPVSAGVRADLSGDAVIDFQTTTDMPFMDVGDPYNSPDSEWGFPKGGLLYTYRMGKFEVTAGQYCEFLNAVAATDTYYLYVACMWTQDKGCKIERHGSPPPGRGPTITLSMFTGTSSACTPHTRTPSTRRSPPPTTVFASPRFLSPPRWLCCLWEV